MRKGRRGGDKKRGIIVGGMILGLLMGCNNGIAELEKKNESILSISNLRQGFLDVFATFGDLLKDAFGIKAETTKKEVGEELGKVGAAVQVVKGKLEEIKGSESYNLIKDKADGSITKVMGILEKIVTGTNKIKDAAGSSSDKVGGEVDNSQNANPADTESVRNLIAGINMIFEAAKGVGIEPKGNAKQTIADSKKIANLSLTIPVMLLLLPQ